MNFSLAIPKVRVVGSSPAPVADYIVDRILPAQEVHLLGGISDAGKTRWLFHWLLEWEQGIPLLGYAAHPCSWVYVAADRTARQAVRTLDDMGIDPACVPLVRAFGADRKTSLWQTLAVVAKTHPQAGLVVVEGFQKFTGDSKAEVTEYLENAAAYCERTTEFPKGITLLGVVESPKLKPLERYTDPRQRISGVSAWGYYSSTVMLIEGKDLDTPERTLYVCPKQGRRLRVKGRFREDGHLVFPP